MHFITKYLIPISLVLFIFLFFAMGKSKTHKQQNCVEDKKFYEPMLIPIKEDTLTWERIKNRFSSALGLSYIGQLISVTRGLADTSLLENSVFDKYPFYDGDVKRRLAFSPLVIKGKILEIFCEDTLVKKNLHFQTNYLIEIKKVYKSNYKDAKIGDKLIAKTHLYGYSRSSLDNKVYYNYGFEFQPYQKDNTYFFALDKYWGMMVLHNFLTNEEYKMNPLGDIYCPYSFYLGTSQHLQSEQYEKGIITDEMINYFLNASQQLH